MTDQNDGSERRRAPLDWGALPPQPALTSDRIKTLLSKALTDTAALTEGEIREIAAAVVYHLVTEKK